jgi:NAD(P)-dependent dehydrogenase (short-subunit alcohol dehydrogenase family)
VVDLTTPDHSMSARPLDGRTAVVTGGAAGIGGGISRLFTVAGATVICLDIDETSLGELQRDVAAVGGRRRSLARETPHSMRVMVRFTSWSTTSATSARLVGSSTPTRPRGTRTTRSTSGTSSG